MGFSDKIKSKMSYSGKIKDIYRFDLHWEGGGDGAQVHHVMAKIYYLIFS